MVTQREWLATHFDPPLAKFPSRGRLSKAAHAAIAEAIANGMQFDEPVKAVYVKPEPEPSNVELIAESLDFQ